jgi:5'-nucleotidase
MPQHFITGCVLLVLSACAQLPSKAPIEINLVALNDFHGYLQPSPFSYTDPANEDLVITTELGGIATLGGMLNEMRKADPYLLFVGVGDLIGGAPPISAMWADEPSIEAMNLLGMDVSAVGNHELDEGKQEFLRQIHGGCESSRPEKSCQLRAEFSGTQFPYIAANLFDSDTGKLLVHPYVIKTVRGVKLAFVGAQVKDLTLLVSASSLAGIAVTDEADAINALIPELKRQGVDIVVAVVHQGGNTVDAFDQPDCTNLEGEIVDIAQRLDPAVDLLLSAHTHEAYLCNVGDLPVTQGGSYGRMVSQVTLVFDPEQETVVDVSARNVLVDPKKYTPDSRLLALLKEVETRSEQVLARPIARIGAELISRTANAAGESAMGDLVADAQLFATAPLGAQVAFMNTGGIRSELMLANNQLQVTYAQVASVHPFKGSLQLLTLTGAQIKALLEQQWQSDGEGSFKPLQISHSLRYQWNPILPRGERVLVDSIKLNGEVIQPDTSYRISVNSFLADGGDGFLVLTQGADRVDTEIPDLPALIDYLVAQDKLDIPAGKSEPGTRIVMIE